MGGRRAYRPPLYITKKNCRLEPVLGVHKYDVGMDVVGQVFVEIGGSDVFEVVVWEHYSGDVPGSGLFQFELNELDDACA